MTERAIVVDGLGKQYHIGAVQDRRYRTIRDGVADAFVAPFRRAAKLMRGQATGAAELDETIWALRDVSFEVKPGEVIGIIGHNGAGKSTLLKILSQITEPSEGQALIYGRVGSLLEVGTGFHPELTGRENVYLNGAILGMTRVEIEANFDEMVAFSEVEKFIDTPVKHYSTGMQLRLAFAVAAHLEPEILIVDEVLAVGDAAFQRKCLGKMGNVAEQGRTVLLVSHNMSAVTQLCDRALLVSHGRLAMDGDAPDVVSAYLSSTDAASGSWSMTEESGEGTRRDDATIESVRVLNQGGQPEALVPFDQDFSIEIGYTVHESIRDLAMLYAVINERGEVVWASWDTDSGDWAGAVRKPGTYVSSCRVPARFLRPGRYYLNAVGHVPDVRMVDKRMRVVAFDVSPSGYRFDASRDGAITPALDWTVERVGS